MGINEFATRLERRFRFSKKELLYLLVTVAVAAFILNFRSWGGEEFSLEIGIGNLLITFLVVFISFLVHFSVQKIVGLSMGYVSEYKYWLNGILISLIVAFFTYGYVPLFFTGSLWYEPVTHLRVGTFRGAAKHKDLGYISFAGPLSNILIILLIAPVFFITKIPFLKTAIIINLLIAIFSLLPIPTFEKIRQFKGGTTGLYLFIASRWLFVLVFVTFLIYALFIILLQIYSYIIAIVIGGILTAVYYSLYEIEK